MKRRALLSVILAGIALCGCGEKDEFKVLGGSVLEMETSKMQEENGDGIVALTCFAADWWEEYSSQVMDILDPLSFEPDIREGGAYVYNEQSEVREIGLQLSLKNISSTGATLVWSQYDKEAPTGQLEFGDDFVLEQKKNGVWEEVPVVVEGNYGFHAIAYRIAAGETGEHELDWKWLYGELVPGEYRIGKGVNDFRGSGDYDKYTVYAYFILN